MQARAAFEGDGACYILGGDGMERRVHSNDEARLSYFFCRRWSLDGKMYFVWLSIFQTKYIRQLVVDGKVKEYSY